MCDTDLLPRYFQPLLTLPQVYEEFVTQGRDRPGVPELATACERGAGGLLHPQRAALARRNSPQCGAVHLGLGLDRRLRMG